MMFALFSRHCGAPSAFAAIGVGMLTWGWSKYVWGFGTRYIAALALALVAYLATADLDRRRVA